MKRTFKILISGFLALFFCVYLCLGFIAEPARMFLFYMSQIVFPFVFILTLLGGLVSMGVRKRWGSKASWLFIGLTFLLAAFPFLRGLVGISYPAKIEKTQPQLTMRLPFDEPTKIAWGGDNVKTNYHAAHADQRWAYDMSPEPGGIDSANLEDYGCYGATIVAPVNGTILKIYDQDPDQIPNQIKQNFKSILGNHIVLQPEGYGKDEVLVFAHLKPGSIQVAENDAVTSGRPIAACGNSGNTTEPHLHIHFMKALTPSYDFGYGLPLFISHSGGEKMMPKGGYEMMNDKIVWTGEVVKP